MQPTIYGITHDDVTESEIMELIRNPKLYFLISNCRGGQLPGEVFQFINTPPHSMQPFHEIHEFWSNLQNFIHSHFLQNVSCRKEYMQNSSLILMHFYSDFQRHLIPRSDKKGHS